MFCIITLMCKIMNLSSYGRFVMSCVGRAGHTAGTCALSSHKVYRDTSHNTIAFRKKSRVESS